MTRPARAFRPIVMLTLALLIGGCGSDNDPPASEEARKDGAPASSEQTPAEAGAGSSAPDDVRLAQVGSFDQPLHAFPIPGTDLVGVVEKGGRVIVASGMRCVDADRCPEEPVDEGDVILDLRDQVSTGAEQGLLGVVLHPDWPDDDRMFVNYTDRDGTTRVEAWQLPSPTTQATRQGELLRIPQPYENHNGGHLAFGPDGLLYVGTGDGGAAGDPEGRAQEADELLGKLLRLDVDGGGKRGYAIPEGNLGTGAPEVWAVGLRNPWRFSFDAETGDLWIGDVGQNAWEEIDALPAGRLESGPTPNFGWDLYEGYQPFEPDNGLGPGELVEPVLAYGRDDGCSVTGGVVYRGALVPALRGHYLFADFCQEDLRIVEAGDLPSTGADEGEATWTSVDGVGQVASFASIQAEELLVVSLAGGIYQVVPR